MGHDESYNMAELTAYEYGAGAVGVVGVGAIGLNTPAQHLKNSTAGTLRMRRSQSS